MDKKIGLVLSGGGAKGYAHIALLKLLDELEIKPNIVAGTSMGAIIGAAYCIGLTGIEIEEAIKGFDILKYTDITIPKKGLIKGDKLLSFFREFYDNKKFEDLKIPILINAVDLNTGGEIIFSGGDLSLAVRASMSIPGIIQPIEMDGHTLIDGGVTNNIPIGLIKDQCDIIITSNVNYPYKSNPTYIKAEQKESDDKNIPNVIKTLLKTIYILETNKKTIEYARHASDIFITPKLKEYNLMDFSKANDIIRIGEEEVVKYKNKIKSLIHNE